MKREHPLKFVAVERELARLRGVERLEDPHKLRIEIQRHAVLLGEERCRETAARLYTRTLALTELLGERAHEHKAARRVIEAATTQPFLVQQAMKARPLPVLSDFDARPSERGDEGSLSLLERRVQKLALSPSPLVRVLDELDTEPMTDRDMTSDVFLPVAERALVITHEASTSPARDVHSAERTQLEQPACVHEAVTIGREVDRAPVAEPVDPRAAPTLEMPARAAPNAPNAPNHARTSDEHRLRDNAREQELLRVAAKSARAFLDVQRTDPERAIRIQALVSTFQFSPELKRRDRALDAHARAWQRRAGEKDTSLWRSQEDNVLALGMFAQQRAAEERALTRVAREEFAQGARELTGPAREALRADLKELLAQRASADGAFLKRELLRAADDVNDVNDVNDARLLALALETYPHRPFTTPRDDDDSQTLRLVIDERRTQVSARDIQRLESELVDLRAAYALREITAGGAARAERVVQILSSVKDRTEEAPPGVTP